MKRTFTYISILIGASVFGQKIQWEKSLGGNQSEYLTDVLATADYGFILAGSSFSGEQGDLKSAKRGNIDAWLWKMKENGDEEWQYRIGGDGNDFLKSISRTKDGGFLLGITSTSSISGDKTEAQIGNEDIWLVKLTANRQIQWQKTLGGLGSDEVVKVLALKDGGYGILSTTNSMFSGNKQVPYYGGKDVWVIRLDQLGNIVWQKSFGGEYNDIAVDLVETQNGGLLIGALSNSPISGNKKAKWYGNNDYWLIELDNKGNELWQNSYGGNQDDQLKQLQVMEDGSYYLFGMSNSESSGNKSKSLLNYTDYWVVKVNTKGKILEEQNYGSGAINLLSNGYVTSTGDLFLGGSVMKNESRLYEYTGVLLDNTGDVVWEKNVSSKGIDFMTRAIQTRDGGYLFAGTSNGVKSQEKKVNNGKNDFWLVKMEKGTKKKEEHKRDIIEVYPNPTKGETNIVITFDYNKGSLQVFDLSGRLLLSKDITYQTEVIDFSKFAQGVYIISVKTDKGEASEKVIRK